MHPSKQQLTCATGETPARCDLRWLVAKGKWNDGWILQQPMNKVIKLADISAYEISLVP